MLLTKTSTKRGLVQNLKKEGGESWFASDLNLFRGQPAPQVFTANFDKDSCYEHLYLPTVGRMTSLNPWLWFLVRFGRKGEPAP